MRNLLFIISLLIIASGCSKPKHYRIGISQCSADIWRDKQNAELRVGAYAYENMELCFAAAYDSDQRQIQQIDSLLNVGIDLLIVAPNQLSTISPAIDRAYDRGIPVIVFERKTSSKKFTAYVGADNYEMGRSMGEFIVSRLGGHGTVLEVMGLKGSSPAIERHKGFSDVLRDHPGITLKATLHGDWSEQSAYNAVKQYLDSNNAPIDYVFGQNDRMALGARRAITERRPDAATRYSGIDALPGDRGGISMVRDSILDASYIYPTHGEKLIEVAAAILNAKSYDKEVKLTGALVTADNAGVILLQAEEIKHQSVFLDNLHKKADNYLAQLDSQRYATVLLIILIIVLVLLLVLLYLYYQQRARIAAEREELTHTQLEFYTQVAHQLRTPLTLIDGPLKQLGEVPEMAGAGEQTRHIYSIVSRNAEQLTALVNKILEAQQGKLLPSGDADSATIERIKAEMEPATEPAAVSQDETHHGNADDELPQLLVVDDNDDIRAYLSIILQGRYNVAVAPDGEQGLAVARETVPDLIISDVMMPVMDGLEFTKRIKSDIATSHIPVILLTARALSHHKVEGYESGADGYITKPFSPQVLLARVDNLLRSRRQLKDLLLGGDRRPAPEAATMLSEADRQFIQRFAETLDSRHADSTLGVEDLAAALGMSRIQLYRKIKAMTGLSPNEHIRKARLQRARQLLHDKAATVAEIAYRVGFTTPSYFTKCFKEEFGILPTDPNI